MVKRVKIIKLPNYSGGGKLVRITGLPKFQLNSQVGKFNTSVQQEEDLQAEAAKDYEAAEAAKAAQLTGVPLPAGTPAGQTDVKVENIFGRTWDSDLAINITDSVTAGETMFVPNQGGLPAHFNITGPRHTHGGVPLKAQEGTFIFSDTKKMEIGGPILRYFGKPEDTKKKYTPAELAKQYDINYYRAVLANPNSDDLQRETAEQMIKNYNIKLAMLALASESKKAYPQEIPEVATPYMSMMGIKKERLLPQQGQQQPQQQQQPQETISRYGGGYFDFGGIPMGTSFVDNFQRTEDINYEDISLAKYGMQLPKHQTKSVVEKSAAQTVYDNAYAEAYKVAFNPRMKDKAKADADAVDMAGIIARNARKSFLASEAAGIKWKAKDDDPVAQAVQAEKARTSLSDYDRQTIGREAYETTYKAFMSSEYVGEEGSETYKENQRIAQDDAMAAFHDAIAASDTNIAAAKAAHRLDQSYAPGEKIKALAEKQKRPLTYQERENIEQEIQTDKRKQKAHQLNEERIKKMIAAVPYQHSEFTWGNVMAAPSKLLTQIVYGIGDAKRGEDVPLFGDAASQPGRFLEDSPYIAKAVNLGLNTNMYLGVGAFKLGSKILTHPITQKIALKTTKAIKDATTSTIKYVKDMAKATPAALLETANLAYKGRGLLLPLAAGWALTPGIPKKLTPEEMVAIEAWTKGLSDTAKTSTSSEFPGMTPVVYPTTPTQTVTPQPAVGDTIQLQTANPFLKKYGGGLTQYEPGGIVTKYNDGTTSTLYPDGRVEVKDASGKLVRTIPAKSVTSSGTKGGKPTMSIYTPGSVAWLKEQGEAGYKVNVQNEPTVGWERDETQSPNPGGGHNLYGDVTWSPQQQAEFKGRQGWVYEQRPDFDPTDKTVIGKWKPGSRYRGRDVSGQDKTKGQSDTHWFQEEYNKLNPSWFGQKQKGTGFDSLMGEHTFSAPSTAKTPGGIPKIPGTTTPGTTTTGPERAYDPMYRQPSPYGNWWTQDVANIAGAAGVRLGLKAYQPWAPTVHPDLAEPRFYDPTRALAANIEQLQVGTKAAGIYGRPQRFSGQSSRMFGEIAKQQADTLSRYDAMNVGVANQFAQGNADTRNKFALINAESKKNLWDSSTILKQQFDNSKRQANQELLAQFTQGWTNKGKTQALNFLDPTYQVDAHTGYVRYNQGKGLNTSRKSGVEGRLDAAGSYISENKITDPGVIRAVYNAYGISAKGNQRADELNEYDDPYGNNPAAYGYPGVT